jgi:serine/threonine-protein kinase
VLYEMLAGVPPFTGATLAGVLARIAADPPPSLRTVCPAVPPEVDRAVAKALAKPQVDRFAGAAEFAAALRGPAGVGIEDE